MSGGSGVDPRSAVAPGREIRLPYDAYLILSEYVETGDCYYLWEAANKIGNKTAAVLLRSWGFKEACGGEIDKLMKGLRPEDTADLRLVVEEPPLVAPGHTSRIVFSRATIYMPVGMAFADVNKWRVFEAVAAFYQSVKAYPIYLVEYQWQNWRKLTSYDVAMYEGYAVDMSAEGVGEGCGVAYKNYAPYVFAHELIHCAQQAEGRTGDAASAELEAHAMEKLVLLYLDGDETAKKIADVVNGGAGAVISQLTEDVIVEAFARRDINLRALGYVVEGINLLAKPSWADYYRRLGDLPRALTMFHNLVYLYWLRKSPLAASVLVDLFEGRQAIVRPMASATLDLANDRDFLREYAYFAEQFQRGRLSAAHVISLVWLGFNKAYRSLGDAEGAKSYVASVLAEKLRYTASSIEIDIDVIPSAEVADILRQIPQFKPITRPQIGPSPASPQRELLGDCNAARVFREAENFAAEYKRNPLGFDQWQIVSRVAIIVGEFLNAGCRKDHVVEYLAELLDKLGINRSAIKTGYLHGTKPEIAEVLLYLFPNLTWKVPAKVSSIPEYVEHTAPKLEKRTTGQRDEEVMSQPLATGSVALRQRDGSDTAPEEGAVWLAEAVRECQAARLLLQHSVYNLAAFHSYQAVEKALKSLYYLYLRREPPRSVNLLELYRGLRGAGVELTPELVEGLAVLTKYYATSRYPDAAGGPPSELFTKREAEYAMEIASEVVKLTASAYGRGGGC